MEKYGEIVTALSEDDLDFVQSLIGLLKHRLEIKITAQMNYLDLVENRDNKYFFKLFVLENDKWKFFDYGYLKDTSFYGYKTKQLIFTIIDYVMQMRRKPNTQNQIIIVNDNKSYLLFTPYSQMVDLLFKKIYELLD